MTSAAAKLKAEKRKADHAKHQKKFGLDMRLLGIHGWVEEYKFSKTRRYRLDFYHPYHNLGIDLDGAIWGKKSGHNSGKGILSKMEKLNLCQRMNIRVFSFSGDQVQSGEAARYIEEVIREIS